MMTQFTKRNPQCLLVTGANGFLGSEIVRQAIRAGLQVRATGRRDVSRFSEVDYYRADILDPNSLMPALNDVAVVIHSAGLAHIFQKSKSTGAHFKDINEKGTANAIRLAAQVGVQHFILISSVSVYGGSTSPGCDENSACHPDRPYAESKWQAEQRAIEIAKASGMSLTILRMATIYGEEDLGNVARLMRSIDQGRFFWVGDGSNRKSLIHREDAARACLYALHEPNPGINIYNVSAPPCTMRDVVDGLASALGRHVPNWRVPASLALMFTGLASRLTWGHGHLGDLHATLRKWLADDVYDAGRFEKTFNFRAKVKLSEGLIREVAWYRKYSQSKIIEQS